MAADQRLHRLCAVEDVLEGEILGGQLPDGHRVAIYRVDGHVFVTDDRCSHGDASLCDEGSLDGCEVECSWHFGRFDVRTGQPTASPCSEPIQTYAVTIDGGAVWVTVRPVMSISATPSDAG